MSRFYRAQIEITGLEEDDPKLHDYGHFAVKQFSTADDEQGFDTGEGYAWEGSMSLCGGASTEDTHQSIVKDFKAAFPNTKFGITTRWLFDERDWDDVHSSDAEEDGDASEPGHPDNPRSDS